MIDLLSKAGVENGYYVSMWFLKLAMEGGIKSFLPVRPCRDLSEVNESRQINAAVAALCSTILAATGQFSSSVPTLTILPPPSNRLARPDHRAATHGGRPPS